MSNVISLADRQRPRPDATERARRAEAIRARVADGFMPTAADRERLAENLWRLLERLEADGRIRRADVCKEVFDLHDRPEESTKRLRHHALNPAKEGRKRQDQINVLARKATRYVELAEEADQHSYDRLHSPDDWQGAEVLISRRVRSVRFAPAWKCPLEKLRAVTPDDTEMVERWIEHFLGRGPHDLEGQPMRVLALSSAEAQALLDLPDSGAISDWVGPVPEVTYSEIRPGEEPTDWDAPDHNRRHAAWWQAKEVMKEEDARYRFRFRGHDVPDVVERFPMAWEEGTLGYKLERSLLEIDGADGVIAQLGAQARALTSRVEQAANAALKARNARLARLHGPKPEE